MKAIRNTILAIVVTCALAACPWMTANKPILCAAAKNAISVGETALQTAGSKEEIIYWGSYIAGARIAVGMYCGGEPTP